MMGTTHMGKLFDQSSAYGSLRKVLEELGKYTPLIGPLNFPSPPPTILLNGGLNLIP